MIPAWLQAVVLGVVQGATEFIPVSSSGHLVLLPYLLGWDRPGLAFDVALHVGTLGAILVYFRRELWAMARGLAGGMLGRNVGAEAALYRRLSVLLVAATVPVAVAGLLAKDVIERAFESPLATSSFLLGTAALLVVGEKVRDRRAGSAVRARAAGGEDERRAWTGDWMGDRSAGDAGIDIGAVALPTGEDPGDPDGLTLAHVGLRTALIVGVLQVLALFPGVSRSGATITAGLVGGMTREAATRFSFLLALPALVGAAVLSLPDLREPGIYGGWEIVAGVVAAFVAGYLAIRYLVALVARDRLTGFAKYVVAVAVIGYLGYLMIGPPGNV